MDYYPDEMPGGNYEAEYDDFDGGYQDEAQEPRISTVNKVLSYLLRQPKLALNAESCFQVHLNQETFQEFFSDRTCRLLLLFSVRDSMFVFIMQRSHRA